MTLLEAYGTRRRQELTQLWLVIRHAYGADEDNPQSILPPRAERQAEQLDVNDDDFAAELIQRAQNEGR